MTVFVLMLLYAIGCTVVAVHGFVVLVHMTRQTHHGRRLAFIGLTAGGMVGVLEMWAKAVPVMSLSLLASGAVLLVLAGVRMQQSYRARYQRPQVWR